MSGSTGLLVHDRSSLLEQWMSEYGTRVLHLAYFYLKDRHGAEDVAQEVFLKAYRSMDDFRGDSKVYTWLYRITVNMCRDRLRSGWHKRMVLPGELPTVHADSDSPEDSAVNSARRRGVLGQIMQLPDHYREVLVLYYYQDLSTVEIAEVMGLPDNTVKTRLHRGRQQLKKLLQRAGVTS